MLSNIIKGVAEKYYSDDSYKYSSSGVKTGSDDSYKSFSSGVN